MFDPRIGIYNKQPQHAFENAPAHATRGGRQTVLSRFRLSRGRGTAAPPLRQPRCTPMENDSHRDPSNGQIPQIRLEDLDFSSVSRFLDRLTPDEAYAGVRDLSEAA